MLFRGHSRSSAVLQLDVVHSYLHVMCCYVKVRQGSILQQSSGQQVSSVELTGPILPHCIAGLVRLFTHTSLDGNFTATFGGIHEPTLSFNGLPRCDTDESSPLLMYQQLMPSDVCHMDSLGRQAMRELVRRHGLYTWTC